MRMSFHKRLRKRGFLKRGNDSMSHASDTSRKERIDVYPLTFYYNNKHNSTEAVKAEAKLHSANDLMENEETNRNYSRVH